MIESKILLFLAFAAFMLNCSEAYYPYSQQRYYNNNHPGNYDHPNANINRNNNNINYNNHHNSINSNNNNYNEYNRHKIQASNPLLAIQLPKTFLGDFEYVPTPEGYRFSFQLNDGTRRTETGYIPNAGPIYKPDERTTAERTELRMRAKANAKNRKLSPKSLQSLAG